ncbi:MAG: tRNA lysidine(34) synthetase TilS [Methylococcaceae bacterium]|nr:tRNA lysidine(34) synthetase TilS [Methylococcaceae bacterium]
MKSSRLKIQNEIIAALAVFSELNHIYIGYSGGVDSHVLLDSCASLPELKLKITAIYIHHGLQKEADDWASHCQKIAENKGVSFLEIRVDVEKNNGESPEESARNARYSAFKNLLHENDVLLIAQHREDQLETVLLQLFRGSGLKGLAGMPEKMFFGAGWLCRPLLNISKAEIDTYAVENELVWIEDPSNRSLIYDRNFLRQEIIPHLKKRWQSLDKTVARTATHCAEAETLISKIAQTEFETVFNFDNKTLNIPQLLTYSQTEQRLILRQWFDVLGLKMPSQDFLQRILNEVVGAKNDRHPLLHKKGVTFCRKKQSLVMLLTSL